MKIESFDDFLTVTGVIPIVSTLIGPAKIIYGLFAGIVYSCVDASYGPSKLCTADNLLKKILPKKKPKGAFSTF